MKKVWKCICDWFVYVEKEQYNTTTKDIEIVYDNTLNFKDDKTKLTIKDGMVTMPLNYFLELTANDRRRN